MHLIYLEHRNPKLNMNRFYQLTVCPGLMGDWSLVREWGRIGSPGTIRKNWFDSQDEAELESNKISLAKQKNGYRLILQVE
jgi:predicted DNA-binding WGR domain protein